MNHFTEKIHATGPKAVRLTAMSCEALDSSTGFLTLHQQVINITSTAHALGLDHPQFLENLSQRAANDETANGGDIFKSVQNIVIGNNLAGKSQQEVIEL